jgi:hypothetical protein
LRWELQGRSSIALTQPCTIRIKALIRQQKILAEERRRRRRAAFFMRFVLAGCPAASSLQWRKSASGGKDTSACGLLPDLLGYHLRRAQQAVFQDFAATMAGSEFTPGQVGVLALIDANPGLGQTRLAGILRIGRSTLVGVIGRLETRGQAA